MSLFDQYQESSTGYSVDSITPKTLLEKQKPSTPYYATSPIFSLDQVQYPFPGALSRLAVSQALFNSSNINSILVVALQDAQSLKILRIDLDKPDAVEDILISTKTSDGVHKLFLDPSARHLIISLKSGEHYYLFHTWRKPRLLPKFKGWVIDAIAWGRPSSQLSTGTFLIGTNNGHVFEGCIRASDDFFKKEDKFFKQVHTIVKDAVFGLKFEPFQTVHSRYLVLITTANKIQQYIGDVTETQEGLLSFTNLFHQNEGSPPNQQTIPGDLEYSELHFWSPFLEQEVYLSLPTAFAWLAEPGVFYGNFTFGNQKPGDEVFENGQLIPYPDIKHEKSSHLAHTCPVSISLTEFHLLLLYKDRVKGISLLSKDVVYEERLQLAPEEIILGLQSDPIKKTFWLFTNRALYELLVNNEARDIWQFYLAKQNFDTALSYAKTDEQREKILLKQADLYFSQNRYLLSATCYAQLKSMSFEKIALKFMQLKDQEALKVFLIHRLGRLRKQDVTQTTLVSTWLVELFLDQINALEEKKENSKSLWELNRSASSLNEDVDTWSVDYKRKEQDFNLVTEEFKKFLSKYKDRLHYRTVYKLITSHGRTAEFLFLAEMMNDWEKLTGYWLSQKQWQSVLDVLCRQSNLELYYKSASPLLEHVPKQTVDLWMRQSHLNPRHLIPALLRYSMSRSSENVYEQNEAMRYMQYVVYTLDNVDTVSLLCGFLIVNMSKVVALQKLTPKVVHNFLLSLYVQQARVDAEASLLAFLISQKDYPRYDMQYALRLCSQHGLVQSCIHIYSCMQLYESAVDLALQMDDIELAKVNADRPDDGQTHLKKKLWLKIAKHIVQNKRDIKEAIESLRQSSLLKLEDILPFFPDFVLIDDFQQEICAALEEYNEDIDELKLELSEAIKSADNIRVDIRELKHRFAKIPVAQTCYLCHLPCLIRQFYVFSCQHSFHSDCLTAQVISDSSGPKARRIQDIQARLLYQKSQSNEPENLIQADETLSNLKELLDDLVAGECLLCGEAMIKSIDAPFVTDDDIPWL